MRHSTGHVGERITIAYAHIDNQHLRIVEMLGQAVLASAASRRVSNRPFMAAGPAILSHGRPLCALARETRDSGGRPRRRRFNNAAQLCALRGRFLQSGLGFLHAHTPCVRGPVTDA